MDRTLCKAEEAKNEEIVYDYSSWNEYIRKWYTAIIIIAVIGFCVGSTILCCSYLCCSGLFGISVSGLFRYISIQL